MLWRVHGCDDYFVRLGIYDHHVLHILADSAGGHSERIEIKFRTVLEPLNDCIDAARPVEIYHEMLSARAQIDEMWHSPAQFVEPREWERDSEIVRDCWQVQYRVCASTDCHIDCDRVVK